MVASTAARIRLHRVSMFACEVVEVTEGCTTAVALQGYRYSRAQKYVIRSLHPEVWQNASVDPGFQLLLNLRVVNDLWRVRRNNFAAHQRTDSHISASGRILFQTAGITRICFYVHYNLINLVHVKWQILFLPVISPEDVKPPVSCIPEGTAVVDDLYSSCFNLDHLFVTTWYCVMPDSRTVGSCTSHPDMDKIRYWLTAYLACLDPCAVSATSHLSCSLNDECIIVSVVGCILQSALSEFIMKIKTN